MTFILPNMAFGKDGNVVFLTARKGRTTLNGLRASDKSDVIGVIDYPRLALCAFFRASVVVICDLERMTPDYEKRLTQIFARWKEQPLSPLILNRPPRVLRRFELLRKLYKAGVNKTDVHRLDDPDSIEKTALPCFIRDEAGHHLNPAPPRLLHTRDELIEEKLRLHENGVSAFGKLVVEVEDTRDDKGYYCKSAYFRVADSYIPAHRFWNSHWFVKNTEQSLLTRNPELIEKERSFIQSDPHGAEIARIFDLAGIEYGRIDYGVRADGGIHVFEINTNPNHPYLDRVGEERKDILKATQQKVVTALKQLAEANTCARLQWPRDELMHRLKSQV
jgi:hypothetical protein